MRSDSFSRRDEQKFLRLSFTPPQWRNLVAHIIIFRTIESMGRVVSSTFTSGAILQFALQLSHDCQRFFANVAIIRQTLFSLFRRFGGFGRSCWSIIMCNQKRNRRNRKKNGRFCRVEKCTSWINLANWRKVQILFKGRNAKCWNIFHKKRIWILF